MLTVRRTARKDAVNRIQQAFLAVPYPGDDNLVDHPAYPDVAEVRDEFRGQTWLDADVELLRRNVEALSFFTPEAFRYYLPAFLRAALLEPRRADIIPQFVCLSLTPPKDDGPQLRRFRKQMHLFSSDQKDAIRSFLTYAQEHLALAEARQALHRFWSRA